MIFKHIPTGKEFNPHEVRKQFGRIEIDGRVQTTIFPKDPARWDDVLLKRFQLERVND